MKSIELNSLVVKWETPYSPVHMNAALVARVPGAGDVARGEQPDDVGVFVSLYSSLTHIYSENGTGFKTAAIAAPLLITSGL